MHEYFLLYKESDMLSLNGDIIKSVKKNLLSHLTGCFDYTTALRGFHLAHFLMMQVVTMNGFMSNQQIQQKVNVAKTEIKWFAFSGVVLNAV